MKVEQYLSDKFKVMRKEGEVWLTFKGKRMRVVPCTENTEFYGPNIPSSTAFVKGKGKIRLVEVTDKDGLIFRQGWTWWHGKWGDIMGIVIEVHER